MRPILFDIAGYPVFSYSVMMGLALFIGIFLAARECDYRGVALTPSYGVLIFVAGYLGSKLYWVIQFEGLSSFWHVIYFWQPGLVFYGGFIAGALAFLLCIFIKRIAFWDATDIAATYLALAEGIGRIGCFLNGCCWGKACTMPWGVTYRPLTYPFDQQVDLGVILPSAERSLPVHPTQLYLCFGLLVLFVLLRWSLDWTTFAGITTALFCVLEGSWRFFVEFYRGDSLPVFSWLTAGQVSSAGLIAIGIVVAIVGHRIYHSRWGAIE